MSSLTVASPKTEFLPKLCFFHLFSFMEPAELALTERVDKSWLAAISAKDLDPWKEQCRIQGVVRPFFAVEQSITQAIGGYSLGNGYRFIAEILSLIAEYDVPRISYKDRVTVLRGSIVLTSDSWYISRSTKKAK